MKIQTVFSIFLIALTSCSFKPLYSSANSSNKLSLVKLEEIKSPLGAEFCYHMERFLRTSPDYKYLLKVKFDSRLTPILIQKNADVLRQSINHKIEYELSDAKTSQIVTRGIFFYDTSYNAISRPYGTFVEEEHIRLNVMKYIAEELYLRLALFFK